MVVPLIVMQAFEKSKKAHFFICCRNKENKPNCAEKGAEAMFEELKKWAKEQGLKDQIQITKSACLGHCEEGITACLYPQNMWWKSIRPEDTETIKTLLSKLASD
ncbi:MAG: (2Fe-2S) ferredoxin domain-containing protein [Bdellovibrionales bacterium]|nr:(2Fe-2S) ferredoxin domain-containing protein [Bdellovibrionales bacterium]